MKKKKRDKRVLIVLNEDEKADLQKKADLLDLSMSAFMRKLILGKTNQ